MGFHEIQFPTNISYGSIGGPGFNTNIIESDSGQEQRVARFAEPRHRFDVAYGIRQLVDMSELITFYIARQGVANGFRFKNFLDFTTASDHRGAHSSVNVALSPVGDGTVKTFQLIKIYSDSGGSRTRKITKPVDGTVLVSLDSVPQSSGWTVNTTDGIVTFTVAPSVGVVVKAGCEFDVPVRFDKELDESLPMSIDAFNTSSVPSIPLIELIDPLPISDEFFFGGGAVFDPMSANQTLTINSGRVLVFDPDAAGLEIYLPDETNLSFGGPYFLIQNISGVNTIALKKFDQTTLVKTLAINSINQLWWTNATTNAWIALSST